MPERSDAIIVTGGASGIGLATARALAITGAPVIVCDLAEPGERVGDLRFVIGDIRNSLTIESALREAGGSLRGIVLSAARGPFHHDPKEIVEINYVAQVRNALLCQGALVEWASVVMLSSTAGYRFERTEKWLPLVAGAFDEAQDSELWRDVAMMSAREAYVLSKWAVLQAMPRLGRLFSSHRVRVNCVVPGPTITAMSEPLRRNQPLEWEALLQELPSQVANSPEEVANAIAWLCADASRGVFGSFLHVDGGWNLVHGGQRV